MYTLPENVTGFLGMMQYVQQVTGNLFMPVIIMALWFIIFISTKAYSSARAFTFASFFCMIMSIMVRLIGMINNKWMYLFIILTAVGVVWLQIEGSPE